MTFPRPGSPQLTTALFDLELEFLRRVAAAPWISKPSSTPMRGPG